MALDGAVVVRRPLRPPLRLDTEASALPPALVLLLRLNGLLLRLNETKVLLATPPEGLVEASHGLVKESLGELVEVLSASPKVLLLELARESGTSPVVLLSRL